MVLGNRISVFYTLAVTFMVGGLLAYVGMVQQIFAEVFARPALMPSVFALCAIAMGLSAFLNSTIVVRLGMRRISHAALLVYILVTLVHVLVAARGLERLWTFVAMAMEPLGAIAGIGASLQGFITMFGGAMVGAAIGRQFNGSTLPLAAGALIAGLASLLCVLLAEQGRLFRPHHPDSQALAAGISHA